MNPLRLASVAAVLVTAGVLLVGCSGSEGGSLSSAFCNDLKSGYTPFQILGESVSDGTYSPSEAADLAYGWTANSCPEELKSNESLRTYLQNWDINPDV